jgi:CyaY protein
MALTDESSYRRQLDETFKVVDGAFEDVDPDLAESVYGQGMLTIVFADGRRCILSPQAPVRQLWVAFKDRAWHLDVDPATGRWTDDRGEGLELDRLIADVVKQAANLELPGLRVPRKT